ncbi:MAG: glycosyltransferase, partial [Synergistaceae bacterium]|nr:glycosyltransferase [Synergistaceae bacterium]
ARAKKRGELGVPDDALMILAAGRFVDWKGFKYAIEGYCKFLRATPALAERTRLCLVGDGPEKEKYVSLAEDMGIAANVSFYGFAQDIRPWLWAADIFIQPSYEPEVFSLMLLETMAAGTPAIVTNIGGTLDIVRDNENGWLVDIRDSSAIAEKLEAALGDMESLERAAKNAASDAARFDVSGIAAETIELYKRVSSAG